MVCLAWNRRRRTVFVSNEGTEQEVGMCWCFMAGDTPDHASSTGCCCLSTLAAHHNHLGLGPSPGNSGPATVGWSLKWGFLTNLIVRGEPPPPGDELHF